jgi:hypothetical protein
MKTQTARQLHTTPEKRVIQKRFPALEVNPINARIPGLKQNIFDLLEGERAALPRTAPYKAMVTFEGALVG